MTAQGQVSPSSHRKRKSIVCARKSTTVWGVVDRVHEEKEVGPDNQNRHNSPDTSDPAHKQGEKLLLCLQKGAWQSSHIWLSQLGQAAWIYCDLAWKSLAVFIEIGAILIEYSTSQNNRLSWRLPKLADCSWVEKILACLSPDASHANWCLHSKDADSGNQKRVVCSGQNFWKDMRPASERRHGACSPLCACRRMLLAFGRRCKWNLRTDCR